MNTTTLKLEEIMVRDIMIRGVVTVQYGEMLPKIAEIMTEEDISCLVIVDQSDEAAGIISSLDLVRAFSEGTTTDIEKTTAEDIMTPFVVEAYPEMNLREVSNIMIAKSVHRVIVLSPIGRKPVGLLSATDIVKQMRQIGG
ncbi:MAG: CBS domain-containing protein [Proteobacteria bacterium]|jgi:CBS domain-containing protein|nr:CBS domain-containing protein [Pseudomonadota bacterium]MBU1649913.1 CBS domain-containing protein [Pseudomonadota bacterium]